MLERFFQIRKTKKCFLKGKHETKKCFQINKENKENKKCCLKGKQKVFLKTRKIRKTGKRIFCFFLCSNFLYSKRRIRKKDLVFFSSIFYKKIKH